MIGERQLRGQGRALPLCDMSKLTMTTIVDSKSPLKGEKVQMEQNEARQMIAPVVAASGMPRRVF